jgi:hypothetical protein
MKYIIEFCERKRTTTGKEKLDCTLTDENKVETHGATIWSDFPNFNDIMVGFTVEGDLVPAKDPKYGPTLYPIKKVLPTGSFGGPRGIAKAQEVKGQQIKEAQERKSDSIAFFNATNSAIALVTKLIEPALQNGTATPSEAEMKVKIRAWREWFINEYEDYNTKAPF